MQLTIVLCVVEYGTGAEEHILRLAGLVCVEWSPCTNKTHALTTTMYTHTVVYMEIRLEDNNNPRFFPPENGQFGPEINCWSKAQHY